ncbi:uncharacterized protein RJT21DRAFT_115469 [Scheffersomyces amazonensis]|uniref:uncharacterized protein n=1 Tax=Scheffersomyces amazonensis TaxID=1078765 RepID=UPI00315D5E59
MTGSITTSFLHKGINIPGVKNNTKFIKWIEESEINLHNNLSVNISELGGIGLFFKNEDNIQENEENEDVDLIILRIPESSTFDYKNLLIVLEVLKVRDKTFVDEECKDSELIVNVLEIFEPSTETQIVTCYFIAFKMLQEIQTHSSDYYKTSPLRKFDIYLEILLHTSTLAFPSIESSDDPFISSHIQNSNQVKFEFDSFIQELNILYDHGIDFEGSILPFRTFYQLTQAIKSRTLEIPHEHNEEDDDDEDGDDEENDENEKSTLIGQQYDLNGNTSELENLVNSLDFSDTEQSEEYELNGITSDNNLNSHKTNSNTDGSTISKRNNNGDYYTNVTLVPILDFANHKHNSNSYFDIDRSNKDIVLKLRREIINELNDNDEIEITISYSPTESIQHFITTYGFIPELVKNPSIKEYYQLFEYKLIHLDKYYPHATQICKWLRIMPQVQIVLSNKGDDQIYFNIYGNKLPLLFLEGLEYNEDWKKGAVDNFKEYNEIPNDYEIEDNKILEILHSQESQYDVINGVEPIGLKYKGEIVRHLSEIRVNNPVEEDNLILKSIDYIIKHIRDKLQTLRNIKDGPNENEEQEEEYDDDDDDDDDNYKIMINNYYRLQKRMLEIIVAKYDEDPRSVVLPEHLAHHDWEINYRSLPREMELD